MVAEFVIQHERTEDIAEALKVIKQWNPTGLTCSLCQTILKLKISAVEQTFPATIRAIFVWLSLRTIMGEMDISYICVTFTENNHRRDGQKITKMESHLTTKTLSLNYFALVLGYHHQILLRAFHWVSTIRKQSNLKENDTRKGNSQLHFWLSTTWLSIPEICTQKGHTSM